MRVALGLIAATIAAPAAVAMAFAGLHYLEIGWFGAQDWSVVEENIWLYAMFSAPVAFFIALSAGAPFAHRLAEQGHRGIVGYALIGLLLGASPFVEFDGYILGSRYLLETRPTPDMEAVVTAARWAALGAWCGLWSGLAYWVAAIRQPARST